MNKPLTVNEVAKLSGVTVRTLHYYDQIGLLRPSSVAENGYRLYDSDTLSRLWEIMFYRELDLPLCDIADMLSCTEQDKRDALQKHSALLAMKRDRLNSILEMVNELIEGGKVMSFTEFDKTEIENTRDRYAKEARERYGNTDAYKESEKRTAAYSSGDWQTIEREAEAVYLEFLSSMTAGADSADAANAVQHWQQHITRRYYNCTDEILAGLGEMYVGDERFTKNINTHGEGLAEFMSAAIKSYCKK